MRIPRVYSEQTLEAGLELALEPGPSQHLARALRLGPGDPVRIFDGQGRQFLGRISAVERKTVHLLLECAEDANPESPLRIHLGIGISRGERFDWVVQKATELGVAEISPLLTERVEVRLQGDREARKQRHWQQVAMSACEQCGRSTLPRLHEARPLAEWLPGVEEERRLVLHHRSDAGLGAAEQPRSVCLLVGPEGGLAEAEIDAALAAGFAALALGPRVLRTETAPVAALAILQARWGDMG